MRHSNILRLLILALAAGMMLACGLPLGGMRAAPTQSGGMPTATDTPPPTQTPFEVSIATATVTPIPSATTTATPAGVVLLAPVDGSDLSASGLLTFDWQPYLGASTYRIDFTNPKGAVVSFNENSTRHERYAESLPWGGDFSWQVFALDSRSRVLASSNLWQFYKPAASKGDDGEEPKEYEEEERHP